MGTLRDWPDGDGGFMEGFLVGKRLPDVALERGWLLALEMTVKLLLAAGMRWRSRSGEPGTDGLVVRRRWRVSV